MSLSSYSTKTIPHVVQRLRKTTQGQVGNGPG